MCEATSNAFKAFEHRISITSAVGPSLVLPDHLLCICEASFALRRRFVAANEPKRGDSPPSLRGVVSTPVRQNGMEKNAIPGLKRLTRQPRFVEQTQSVTRSGGVVRVSQHHWLPRNQGPRARVILLKLKLSTILWVNIIAKYNLNCQIHSVIERFIHFFRCTKKLKSR